MNNDELIKKAKLLGLTDQEIQQFIENQEIAKKYGIDDDCYSINVEIDESILNENNHHHCDCDDDCCGECCSESHNN